MKFDLIISDYDGTLGGVPENTIDEQTVSAINKYIDKGGKFVVCTGRMFSSIQSICKKVGLKGIVVAFQGAMIKERNAERLGSVLACLIFAFAYTDASRHFTHGYSGNESKLAYTVSYFL